MKDKSLIVIVTYNSADFIEDCLISIAEQDYREWQLVMVDNDSSDDTVKRIRHLWNQTTAFNAENFKLITLKKNIGFARAVNHAVFSRVGTAAGARGKEDSTKRSSRHNRAILSRKDKRGISGYRTFAGKSGGGAAGDLFDHLILLNPDICLLPGALKNLTGTFGRAGGRQIGACGGLILDYEKDVVQHLAGKMTPNFITYHEGAGISLSSLDKGSRDYDISPGDDDISPGDDDISPGDDDMSPGDDNISGHAEGGSAIKGELAEADYVTGAFFATRFSLYVKAGGFDSGYRPLYFEELDYCLKLKEAGWRVVSNLRARCRHFEGASVKKFSRRFYRHYHKNRIRCAVINLDIPEFIRFFIPAELKWFVRSATRDQALPVLYAYFINILFLLYNLGVKIKNYLILNKIELK